ncbi:hypothetical protein L6452_14775 [Arctium lappa]|uniref:Uncharacterized protein n=1 Tax=Arctium lappa TaxID=4217 RepID=A0ACB9CM23_ARCLA|nr:hypothetical protein L6452_14775 [Arctium lappa]
MMTRGAVRTATTSTENADTSTQPITSASRGRGRGRGRGQSKGATLAPFEQVSVTSRRGHGRPRGTGRGALPIMDQMLMERITRVLQATLSGMLAATGAGIERQTRLPQVEMIDDNTGKG